MGKKKYVQKRKSVFEFKPHIASLLKVNDVHSAELDVVGFVMEGLSNQEIADKLCVEVCTVKFHLNRLFKVFNVKNRVNFILKLARRGYFTDDPGKVMGPAGTLVSREEEERKKICRSKVATGIDLPTGASQGAYNV